MRRIPFLQVLALAAMVAPAPSLARLHVDLNQPTAAPDIQERLAQRSAYPLLAGSPEQFAKVLRAEQARWTKVIRYTNIRLEA